MKILICLKCGSNELFEDNRYLVCTYCRVRFVPESDGIPVPQSVVSVHDDIQQLLRRCETEPGNKIRLANLVLDIDPSNLVALSYLK